MATFYGWGSTASRLQPLRGGSLLFTIQSPEISDTPRNFCNLLYHHNCNYPCTYFCEVLAADLLSSSEQLLTDYIIGFIHGVQERHLMMLR